MSYDSSHYTGTNVYLTYNNTNYSTVASGSGDNKLFTSTITVPTVLTTINKSFYFDIGLINSTGTYYFHSSVNNQTVTNLSIDNCTTGTYQLFNLSLYNEDDSAFLNGITQNTSVEISFEIKDWMGQLLQTIQKTSTRQILPEFAYQTA